jgi:uncharacterized protein YndB with AHSA1/START domain
MTTLAHRLDRTIVIQARPETVFRFFTDEKRWAAWWGQGSTIEPRRGGRVHIRYPDGTEVGGEVVEIEPPERLVFTYGYLSGTPIPVGASQVSIRLEGHAGGTRLSLTHEFAEAKVRDVHVQGWRYQLSLFANVVADEVNAGAGERVDSWFEAWRLPEGEAREALGHLAVDGVRFRDRFSLVDGLADLVPHVMAAQRFMPGLRLERRGDVRHCQGTVLADWIAVSADGRERGRGTNVFVFDASGRIESVTGFWAAPVAASR